MKIKNLLHFDNLLLLTSILSFVSGAVYFSFALNYLGILMISAVTALLFWRFKIYAEPEIEPAKEKNRLIVFSLLFLMLVLFFLLFRAQTFDSIASPWLKVPSYYHLLLFSSVFFFLFTEKKLSRKTKIIFSSLFFFLFLSVINLIYGIGFGYDYFIHHATLKYISEFGSISPKPFYYSSYYGLIIFLNKIFFLPYALMNKLIVPVLAALFIPFAFYKNIKSRFDTHIVLMFFAMLALPYPFLTFSTPQNFSYLFLLLAIIYSLGDVKKNLILIYFLSLAALLAQPIAGLPAIILSLLLTFKNIDFRYNKIGYYLLAALNIFIIPLSFLVISKKLSSSNFALPVFSWPDSENSILNLIYLYGFNYWAIALSLAAYGVIINIRKKIFDSSYLIISAGLLISSLLLDFISFDYLISYEQDDFKDRLVLLFFIFLLPYILLAIRHLILKIFSSDYTVRYSSFIFLIFLISLSHYFSYPRKDNYSNYKGISTSRSDLAAVARIDELSGGKNYVVLASQQVSAAALYRYGFKKYYHGDIFYYPVPTGAPLYQYYLDMVYKKPLKKYAIDAADYAGADETYLVINKYWTKSDKIIAEAKLEADYSESIDNGEAYIFKYSKNNPGKNVILYF